jgi:hypothetical protein
MASKSQADVNAQFDALVLDAVRWNRYRGAYPDDMTSYVGIRYNGTTTDKTLETSLTRLQSADKVVRVGKRWLLHPNEFRNAKGEARKPEFLFEDTWILMCIRLLNESGPCDLNDIIPLADGINKAIPTIDELHGAFNRLLAARLISTHKGRYVPTAKAEELFEKVQANCRSALWDQMDGLRNILKCPCCGVRLKRVTWRIKMTEEEVTAAYKQYSSTLSEHRKKEHR